MKPRKSIHTLIAAGALLFALGAADARALPRPDAVKSAPFPVHAVADINALFQGATTETIQPAANVHEIHDEATFAEKTKSYHVIPFNDSNLEFEISLPADWQADKMSVDSAPDLKKLLLGDIARFRSPYIGTAQAIVTVQAQQLTREISAKNWLKNYILTSGYTLQDDVTETSLQRASAGYITVQEGRSTYNYITTQINGSLIILAKFEVPLPMKDYIAFLQKKSIDSFKLVYTNDAMIEEQKVFTLVDAIKFSYPQSWDIIAPDFKDMNRVSVQLHSKSSSGAVEGYINCLAIRRSPDDTFKKETTRLKKDLATYMGIEFQSLRSSDKYPVSDRFLLSRMESYEISFKNKRQADQEMRLLILGDKEWYIFMYLITPMEQDNLAVWAHNSRSFDIITKSIK